MQNDTFPGDISALLADDGQPSLSGWYADPLSQPQRQQLLLHTRSHLRQRYQRGSSCALPGIVELLAQFSGGADVQTTFNTLRNRIY